MPEQAVGHGGSKPPGCSARSARLSRPRARFPRGRGRFRLLRVGLLAQRATQHATCLMVHAKVEVSLACQPAGKASPSRVPRRAASQGTTQGSMLGRAVRVGRQR